MKQRNGRMMVLAGTAVCSGLVIGTVAAAAGGVAPTTEVATTRFEANGTEGRSAVAAAMAAVAERWAQGQAAASAVAPGLPAATADAVAVVAAAAAATPVTVAPPTTAAAAAPTTEPAVVAETAAAEPVVVPEAPAAPAPAVAAETAAVEAAPPAPAPTGSSVEAAIAAWFPDVYDQAIRVADCESSLNPNARSSGGANHGLFQINNVHRDNFEAVTGQPWSMVYDAYYNSQYARRLYDASGWRPWTCRP